MIITIDGLSVNGKTTLAHLLSDTLGYKCFNTGAVYRCYALHMKKNNLNVDNRKQLINELKKLTINFDGNKIILNNIDVTEELYTIEISVYSNAIAPTPEIKELVRKYQKSYLKKYNTIMEGRDIATRIAPNADIKFYLYADKEKRIERMQKYNKIDFNEALKKIEKIDEVDINNGLFIKPENAIEIDTSNMSIEEVYNLMLKEIKKKVGGINV